MGCAPHMGVATNLVHTDHLVGCCVDRKRARLVDEGRELARHLHCQAGHEQQHDPRLGQKSAEARGRSKNHIEKRSLESRAAVALRDHVHRNTPAALRAPPEAPRCERLRISKTIRRHALTASDRVGRPRPVAPASSRRAATTARRVWQRPREVPVLVSLVFIRCTVRCPA
jgi:hypothetical protein